MSRSLRRRLLLVAGSLAAAVAALALGWFPQGPLRRRVERELQRALGPDARVGGLRVVPWRLGAEVLNLVIAGNGYRLEVPRLELAFDAGLLVGGPLVIASLDLDSPRLELQPAGQAAATAAPTRVPLIRSLSLRGGRIAYEDRAGLTLRLSGLSARGSLGEGELEIEATGGSLEGKGAIPIRSLRANIELSPSLQLRLHSFEALVGMSRLSASGSLGRVGAWVPDVRGEARLDLAEAAALAGTGRLGGDLGIEGQVRGAGSDLWLEARLQSEELSVEGWPLRSLRGRLEHAASGTGRTRLSLRADLLGGRLEAEGRRDGTAGKGMLQVVNVDLEALRRSAGLPGPPLAGALSGRLDAEGELSTSLQVRGRIEAQHAQPELSLNAAAEVSGQLRVSDTTLDLTWTATLAGRGAPGAALGPFAASAEGTARGPFPPAIDGRLAGDLRLATPAGSADAGLDGAFQTRGDTAEADLRVRLFGGTLMAKARSRGSHIESLALAGESLSLATALPAASGRASFHIDASGPADLLSFAGRAAIDELAWQGTKLGPLSATFDGPQSRLRWTLAAPAVNLTGSGELGSGPERRLSGSLRLESTPLSPFARLLAPELTGSLVGSVDLDVPLSHGSDLLVRARLEGGEAARGPWSARLARPAALTLRGSRIEVDGLQLEGEAGHIEASGRLGTRASDPVELRLGAGLDLARFPWPTGWTVAGRTTADVTLSGTIAEPEARGQILTRELSASGPSLPPLSVDSAALELDGREATLSEATVEIGGGRVSLAGSVPLALLSPGKRTPSGALARARLTWAGVAARDLIEHLRPGMGLDASLAGQLEVEAPALTLQAVRGRLDLPSTAIRVEDVAATLEPLSVRLLEGRLQTEGLALETPGGRLTAAGSVHLIERRLEIESHGALALRALSPLFGAGSLGGTAELDLTLTGPFAAPRPDGQLRVQDGSVRLRDIPQALTDIAATLVFEGDRLRIDNGSAVFGGGGVTLAGTSGLSGLILSDVRVTLAGRDLALRYPSGLKSRVDTDLTLTGRSGALLLSGTVKANRGLYDLDIAFSESFRAVAARAPESPLLRSIALDIRIETPNPVRVKNNLADLQASAYLTLRGDLQEPAPFGRLELLNGGKVFLQGRGFAIESGRLEYAGSWDPPLNVTASALIPGTDEELRNDYEVEILVNGTLERPAIRFSSDPNLSEPEIVSLIASGRTGDEALRSSGLVAGEQAAILLAGSLTRGVSDTLRGLGLDEVTIQPELIAREADPGARFTFGKQLGPALRLVYSLSLSNPEDRFVQVEARPGLAATGTLQRRDDGTLTYGLGQRIERGGAPRRRDDAKEERTRLRELRFEADAALPEAVLREQLELRPGDRVTAWQLQERAERLREKLRELGHLEADVGGRLDADAAVFRVRAGARYTSRVEGMAGPPDLAPELRRALFEEEALELGRERLLGVLHGRGHLRAAVQTRVEGGDRARILVFTARPGAVYRSVEVRFPGAHALPESRLLDAGGGPAAWLMTPNDALQRVRQAYTDHYYLAAEIGAPQVEEEGDRLIVTVPVREGPPASIAAVLFEGASRPTAQLAAVAGIPVGAAYDPTAASLAVQRLRDDYLAKGYPGVRVVGSARAEGADVVAVFAVAEGPQVSVGAIEIVGATRTREALVRRQVTLEPGDPLDPRKLAEIERRLLALGVFSRAVIVASPDNPSTLRVEVEERARLRAGYDVRYNDDEKTTVQLDAELGNLFGRALALGGRLRVGRDVREARGSLFMPALGAGDLVGSVFQREEDSASVDPFTLEPIEVTQVERGFQLQQAYKLPDRWSLLYGYEFKRRTFSHIPGVAVDVAALDASLIGDTRDSPLDARRGRFLSANVAYSSSLLGSDAKFIKSLAQAFFTRSLRPSLVWAHGYRLGLAAGFGGQVLLPDDRFNAGGANTVRGYAFESLGPRGVKGDPLGGQAVVVLNQELRYSHRLGLGAALFYDAGNVFESVSDMRLDLRQALGLGVRWDSPVGLLRLDLGFPLGREPGDRSYQIFFGLGQAY